MLALCLVWESCDMNLPTTLSIGEVIVIGICVILVILPPKYDPAIRLKEWLEGWHDDERG